MKKKNLYYPPLFSLIIFFVFAGNSLVHAQENSPAQYWTIENNIKDKSYTIVRYYNDKGQLVLEKVLKNKFIRLNKRDIRKLNKELTAYNEQVGKATYVAKRK